MSSAPRTAANTRAVVVRGEGLVGDNRVAVSSENIVAERTGVLSATGTDAAEGIPVRLIPLADVPRGTMVVHADLARSAGITPSPEDGWMLRFEPATPAASVVLEPFADLDLAAAKRLIQDSTALDGQVFQLGGRPDSDAAWLYLDGTPHRVRAATDSQGQPLRGLVRVTKATTIQLFMSGSRAGVDIVILADCSGSMARNDVAVTGDVSRFHGRTYLSRMDALKEALERMASARLRGAGRTTRIALVRFTVTSTCVFPGHGGMVELGAGDDAAALAQFSAAVERLQPEVEVPGTDIGQALHFGSELLYRHGTAGNDRLLVLVSDGADWGRKGDEATGEVLTATADPVSLMSDLHASLDIRLHAVGVSDEASFEAWWDRFHRRTAGTPHPSIVPNHTLLRELVKVGGGDPGRIGGIDVLEDYFGQLGAGVTHTVGRPRSEVLPKPQPDIAELTRAEAAPKPRVDAERRALADTILRLYTWCIKASRHRVGRPLYRAPRDPDATLKIGDPVASLGEFTVWILIVDHIFRELQDDRLADEVPAVPYEVAGVYEIICAGPLDRIRTLRRDAAHDDSDPAASGGPSSTSARSATSTSGTAVRTTSGTMTRPAGPPSSWACSRTSRSS